MKTVSDNVLWNRYIFLFGLNSIKDKIKLTDRKKITSDDKDKTLNLKLFFSNVVSNFKFSEYMSNDPISDNIGSPFIKLLVK